MSAPNGGAPAAAYGEDSNRINDEAMRVAEYIFPGNINEMPAEVALGKTLLFRMEQRQLQLETRGNLEAVEIHHRINVEAMRVADSEFPGNVNELTAEVAHAKAICFNGEQQRLRQIKRERAARERELEAQRREA